MASRMQRALASTIIRPTTSSCPKTRSISFGAALTNRSIPLQIHPEVEEALANKRPVVALETTLITHGIPYPNNLELALDLESIVRSTGAVPATIGMIGGRVKVGLEKSQLERLADTQNNPSVVKLSRRDIGPAIANKADGGTTCSSTLIFATLAGIKVFATGGLGGVHRGGENSMDVSADLYELTRCPVGLVSSGIKSILDIGRTLEYLETLGIPVVPYGLSKEFPAFFSRKSGFKTPWNAENPSAAAQILYSQVQIGMVNGTLIAVPIPEEYEEEGLKIQKAVAQAVAESEQNGIARSGKEATPWLLRRIVELTGGRSLTSNIALLRNTALIGGQIAMEYGKLVNNTAFEDTKHNVHDDRLVSQAQASTKSLPVSPPKVIIVGASAVDVSSRSVTKSDAILSVHSTVPGRISLTLGGVARNIAEASHRVSESKDSVMLLSPIADDLLGDFVRRETSKLGMRVDGLLTGLDATAACNMVLDADGNLVTGIADMTIIQDFGSQTANRIIEQYRPSIIALDGNMSTNTITGIVKFCHAKGIKILFEPTSVKKSTQILQSISEIYDCAIAPIHFITPNLLELKQIYKSAREDHDLFSRTDWWNTIDSFSLGTQFRMDVELLSRVQTSEKKGSSGTLSFLVNEGIAQMAVNLLPFFKHIFIKCGERGVVAAMHVHGKSEWSKQQTNIYERCVVSHGLNTAVVLAHFPALPVEVVNVTGAGDSFVGALLSRLAEQPKSLDGFSPLKETVDFAQEAAVLTLGCKAAVSPQLTALAGQMKRV
ncbi:carbohydrate kinase [Moniliophthora roreri MCA 2997]|uniref:Carbohydrate kinase n=1 Tax=Moniliophthora roreri (strain MCA 2997) TaxID=1381753 RepID=V2XZG6_MONRO|nr:carbohydrate kinase [Moniliophthora roreri MCA 2997]